MATIDTSLFPSAAAKFQMAEAPTGIDFAALQQQKLANQVTAQNLETAKRNQQKAKLTDAMRDVMTHETPEDAIASIDRHVANGDLTPEQAADAKSKVPVRGADGSLPQGAMAAWRQRNFDDYLATNEQLYESQTRRQQQQQMQDIMGMGATPAPAAPTNALAPTPTVAASTSQPAAPAAAPTTNALVSPPAQGVDVNALRRQITQLNMLGTPSALAQARFLETQIPEPVKAQDTAPKPEKVDVGGSIKIIDINPNSPTYMKEIKSLTKTQTPAQAGAGEKPLTPAQQQKLKSAKAEDIEKYNAFNQTYTDLSNLRDQLIGNPETGKSAHPGLDAITGWSAMLHPEKIPDSEASAASTILETIKGKVKALGRQIASVHGKLGNMAVQEWSMLSDSIQKINPQAKDFPDQINNIVAAAEALQRNSRGRFQYEYDEDVPVLAPPAAGGGKIQVVAPDGKTYTFADQKSADAFKAKAGIK